MQKSKRLRVNRNKLPNIIGVGSPRCGTSTLYQLCSNTKDVAVCNPKEANYWGIHEKKYNPSGLSLDDYISMFPSKDSPFRIDITPVYLCNPVSRERIVQKLSGVKVIVNVRDPLERLFSHFKYFSDRRYSSVNHGYSIEDFDSFVRDAIDLFHNNNIPKNAWNNPGFILSHSLYHSGIKYFYDELGIERVLVLDFSDLSNEDIWPSQIANFLNLDAEQFKLPSTRINPSPSIEFQISDDNKKALNNIFHEDISKLDNLLGSSLIEKWNM
tara:strand:+ start:200 stop:1009 length:810 start_codon:yes stop_codon:yes gene_type:complete